MAAQWQFVVNGLTIGKGTPYVITGVTGWSLGQKRGRRHQRPGADGNVHGREYRDGPTPTIEGFVKAPGFHDAAAAWALWEVLVAAWDDAATRVTPRNAGNIVYRMPGHVADHSVAGRPADLREDLARLAFGRVDFYATLELTGRPT